MNSNNKPAQPTAQQLQAMIEQLQAENAQLKASNAPKTGFKVTEKGGVSMYGLGRFPVTLYLSQWEALISRIDALKAFLATNKSKLTVK